MTGPPATRWHFAALFDRFIQNLRRYVGYDLQYFATIEPQRRLAPHVHIAMRGTIARAEIRRVLAATYHQVWWPDTSTVKYDGDELPVWDGATGNYLDPATGEVLTAWDQALDALGDQRATTSPGSATKFDAQGVLAGSKDAIRCIGYLTKYLTKQIGDCHHPDTDAQRAHAARLAEALRYQPCSPRCANWLRYGIQPKNARPGLAPGRCKSKAHDADHFGYAGRRVLASRKWSGKTLADHRADRKDWLLRTLGVPATDPARYAWEMVAPGDPDHMDHARRLLHAVADRLRWRRALDEARRKAADCQRRILRQPGGGGMRPEVPYGQGSRMLTLGELCEWLNITERHARKLVERDAIPYRKVGHLLRFPEAEVEEWSRPGPTGAREGRTCPGPVRVPAKPKRRRARHVLPKSLIEWPTDQENEHVQRWSA